MRLQFDEGGERGDFNAVVAPPRDWPVTYDDWGLPEIDVWFRAYTTKVDAGRGEGRDYELWADGYDYDCYVEASTPTCFNEYEIAHFPARSREEAERLLQVAADAIYG